MKSKQPGTPELSIREKQAIRIIRDALDDIAARRRVPANTPCGTLFAVDIIFRRPMQPSSDDAAQREVAAAPAEPAAGPETSTPLRAMTKEEAIVELGKLAQTTDEPAALRALLVACKALARDGIHKRRNRAARASRAAQAKEAAR